MARPPDPWPWREGFLLFPRSLFTGPLWASLSHAQRSVVVAVWVRAAYASRGSLTRGELADGLRTLADAAGVTVKVVRTTLARMVRAQDSAEGGPWLGIRKGTPAGTGSQVLKVLHYDKPGGAEPAKGTPSGTHAGTEGAREGHTSGHQEKQGKQKNQGTLLPSPAARGSGSGARRKGAKPESDPRHAALTERLAATFRELRGVVYGHSGGRDGKAVADLLRLSGGDAEEVERRWRHGLFEPEGYMRCNAISDLADPRRWNHLGSPPGSAGRGGARGGASQGKGAHAPAPHAAFTDGFEAPPATTTKGTAP